MDTLDPITRPFDEADAPESLDQSLTEAEAVLNEAAEDAEEVVRKINWSRIAGYAAAGVAIAGAIGGYAYWQQMQKKPETRLARLKRQLGLAHVDFKNLRATIDQFDFEELDRSRRKFGTYARKATHKGAQKVADLTR